MHSLRDKLPVHVIICRPVIFLLRLLPAGQPTLKCGHQPRCDHAGKEAPQVSSAEQRFPQVRAGNKGELQIKLHPAFIRKE